MGEPVLVLDGVWVGFDRGAERLQVLEDVSLSVNAGMVAAVVGARDQGKTTLIRVASGMLPADSGSVRVAGRELTGLSDSQLARVLRSDIGVAVRGGSDARVRDYVGMSLAAGTRCRWRERRLRVAETLNALGLEGCAELRWEDLSGWQRVAVEFAQAAVRRPRLLLVDDVTDGLGLGKKQEAMELLRGFAEDFGCGVLMAVSDHASAVASDRVWQLHRGKLKLMADHGDLDVIPIRKPLGRDQLGSTG